uniref:Endonuclease/exonuclease/phosphatase domain-containing protein n=1 Tax=Populus alba TaxID=43335 RepID=A0A4U5QIM5_POPAL|nr:hypothetical protein D5086_0000103160 [Populus alba]
MAVASGSRLLDAVWWKIALVVLKMAFWRGSTCLNFTDEDVILKGLIFFSDPILPSPLNPFKESPFLSLPQSDMPRFLLLECLACSRSPGFDIWNVCAVGYISGKSPGFKALNECWTVEIDLLEELRQSVEISLPEGLTLHQRWFMSPAQIGPPQLHHNVIARRCSRFIQLGGLLWTHANASLAKVLINEPPNYTLLDGFILLGNSCEVNDQDPPPDPTVPLIIPSCDEGVAGSSVGLGPVYQKQRSRSGRLKFKATFVYGFNSITAKRLFGKGVKERELAMHPWLVLGDFNSLLSSSDKHNGEVVSAYEVSDFSDYCCCIGLSDVYLKLACHTLGQTRNGLEFCSCCTLPLLVHFSDHSPAAVKLDLLCVWARPCTSLCRKLKLLKGPLKELNRLHFSHISERVSSLESHLDQIQSAFPTRFRDNQSIV